MFFFFPPFPPVLIFFACDAPLFSVLSYYFYFIFKHACAQSVCFGEEGGSMCVVCKRALLPRPLSGIKKKKNEDEREKVEVMKNL